MLRKFGLLTLLLTALLLGSAPTARANDPTAASTAGAVMPVQPLPGFPMNFAQLMRGAGIFRSLDDVRTGRSSGWLGGPDTWVSVYQSAQVNGQTYYQTSYGWMPGNVMRWAPSSSLRGVDMRARPGERLAMVFWPQAETRTAPDGAVVGGRVGYDVVSIQETQGAWHRVSANEWMHSKYLRFFNISPRPAQYGPTDKWIEVNLTQQTAIAYEGDTPVYATIVSSGAPPNVTVTGSFHIYEKHQRYRMRGYFGPRDQYDLAEVPWVMYFHQRYALHSAYWHDAFGVVRSHGCVNLSPQDARWFFEWSSPTMAAGESAVWSSNTNRGTWVWVHY